MRKRPSLWSVLKSTSKEQFIESCNWLLYSLGGSTVPIWLGGYVLLPIFNQRFHWVQYGEHGEFALYSAALIAPTLRLIARDVEDFEFVRRQLFLFVGWIILTMSVAIYSGVITASSSAANELSRGAGVGSTANILSLNVTLLFRSSLCLFIVTAIFSFLVTLIDCQRVGTVEIFAAQQAGVQRLEQTFEVTAPETSHSTPQDPASERATDVETGAGTVPSVDSNAQEREQTEEDFEAGHGATDGRESH
jgi:hypothetical protein